MQSKLNAQNPFSHFLFLMFEVILDFMLLAQVVITNSKVSVSIGLTALELLAVFTERKDFSLCTVYTQAPQTQFLCIVSAVLKMEEGMVNIFTFNSASDLIS